MADIKSINGWNEFTEKEDKHSWDDYAKPGDIVSEDVFEHFMKILPPRNLQDGYLQVGEPYTHMTNPSNGKFQGTYMTYLKVGKGQYKYCGNCFPGEIQKANMEGTYEHNEIP